MRRVALTQKALQIAGALKGNTGWCGAHVVSQPAAPNSIRRPNPATEDLLVERLGGKGGLLGGLELYATPLYARHFQYLLAWRREGVSLKNECVCKRFCPGRSSPSPSLSSQSYPSQLGVNMSAGHSSLVHLAVGCPRAWEEREAVALSRGPLWEVLWDRHPLGSVPNLCHYLCRVCQPSCRP